MSAPGSAVSTDVAGAAVPRRSRLGPLAHVLARLGGVVLVLLIVTFLTFAVFYLLPADPAQLACGKPCTVQNLETARSFMGFDRPWYVQFLLFVQGIFAGRTFGSGPAQIVCEAPCLGYSFRLNAPVLDLIGDRLPVTASIAIGAALLWLVIGVAGGVLAAVRRGRFTDRAILGVSILGVSTPSYLFALLGILLFGFTLDMVPVSGYVAFADSPVDWLWHLVLPWTVLALISAAAYTRLTRSQLLDVMGQDYIRTARAKGLTESRTIGRHALRNAIIPVITLFGLDLGGLLGGAVITERVFSMPGLGSLLLEAVGAVDLPVLVGVTLVSAAFIVLANLVVDLGYGLLDPRVRSRR